MQSTSRSAKSIFIQVKVQGQIQGQRLGTKKFILTLKVKSENGTDTILAISVVQMTWPSAKYIFRLWTPRWRRLCICSLTLILTLRFELDENGFQSAPWSLHGRHFGAKILKIEQYLMTCCGFIVLWPWLILTLKFAFDENVFWCALRTWFPSLNLDFEFGMSSRWVEPIRFLWSFWYNYQGCGAGAGAGAGAAGAGLFWSRSRSRGNSLLGGGAGAGAV